MAKIRKLEGFDLVFQRTTEAARKFHAEGRGEQDDGVLIRIPCASQGQAMNVQMQFRQYWQALASGLKSGVITEVDPRLGVAQFAGELAIRANKTDKTIVEIVHRSQLSVARVIHSAIGGVLGAIEAATNVATPQRLPDTTMAKQIERAASGADAQDELLSESYGVAK